MSETNGEQNFDEMLASAVEAKMTNLVQQNQAAMNVFIAMLARQEHAGVNDPCITVTQEEILSLAGQTVRMTRFPDGTVKIYRPGGSNEPEDTRDWNEEPYVDEIPTPEEDLPV